MPKSAIKRRIAEEPVDSPAAVPQPAKGATAARDVPSGKLWAFTEHRTMAGVIADETTPTR